MLIYDVYEIGSKAQWGSDCALPPPEKGLFAACKNNQGEFLKATDTSWVEVRKEEFDELFTIANKSTYRVTNIYAFAPGWGEESIGDNMTGQILYKGMNAELAASAAIRFNDKHSENPTAGVYELRIYTDSCGCMDARIVCVV